MLISFDFWWISNTAEFCSFWLRRKLLVTDESWSGRLMRIIWRGSLPKNYIVMISLHSPFVASKNMLTKAENFHFVIFFRSVRSRWNKKHGDFFQQQQQAEIVVFISCKESFIQIQREPSWEMKIWFDNYIELLSFEVDFFNRSSHTGSNQLHEMS